MTQGANKAASGEREDEKMRVRYEGRMWFNHLCAAVDTRQHHVKEPAHKQRRSTNSA
jgi:hypothetical protein